MNKENVLIQNNVSKGKELPESTLQLVQIYFDTATYDEVERDKKIKTEAQLSLIGGTMGLLTGFSIISGIEIIFFIFRLKIQVFFAPGGGTFPEYPTGRGHYV